MCMGCTGNSKPQSYTPKKSHGSNPFKINSKSRSAPSPARATVSFGTPMIKSTGFKIGKR